MGNLRKKVNGIINVAGLPNKPETRQMVEDLLMDRTDRYTEKELDKIDIKLYRRIMDRTAAEMAKRGVKFVYDAPDVEENVMYG